MPPDPPSVHVLMHMYTGLHPPSFPQILISPPLDQFLNEGLKFCQWESVLQVMHSSNNRCKERQGERKEEGRERERKRESGKESKVERQGILSVGISTTSHAQ